MAYTVYSVDSSTIVSSTNGHTIIIQVLRKCINGHCIYHSQHSFNILICLQWGVYVLAGMWSIRALQRLYCTCIGTHYQPPLSISTYLHFTLYQYGLLYLMQIIYTVILLYYQWTHVLRCLSESLKLIGWFTVGHTPVYHGVYGIVCETQCTLSISCCFHYSVSTSQWLSLFHFTVKVKLYQCMYTDDKVWKLYTCSKHTRSCSQAKAHYSLL